jgi:hypothetical protein
MRKAGVFSIFFVVVLLACAVIAEAQQPSSMPRIGYLAQRNTPTVSTPDRAAGNGAFARSTATNPN